jgi:hypothetical protein
MAPPELRVPPHCSTPAHARHAVAPWLVATGASSTAADDALVVISELVTNGIIRNGDGDIVVRAGTTEDDC